MSAYIRTLSLLAAVSVVALPGDLPPKTQANFLKILANSAGSTGKVDCKDSAIAAELGGMGVSHDASARLAWAGSLGEVKALKAEKKLVVCGHLDWLAQGGSIAVVEENGRPQIYLHMGNIAASGVTLGEGVLKIGKKM